MRAENLVATVRRLSEHRPVFHAEADLQHALAWEIARARPEAAVRLERPYRVGTETLHVDLVLRDGGETCAIELKHWVRKGEFTIGDERFHLRENGAYDIAAYDFWKDVRRIERLLEHGLVSGGFALALSNAPRVWAPRGRVPTNDDAFRLTDGRRVGGTLAWGPATGAGSMKGREAPIELRGVYDLKWQDYSNVGGFRFLVLEIRK